MTWQRQDRPAVAERQGGLDCDLLVVGGGVNGAGIARDAAGRGLSVVLCEQDDLASHTSSCSTKLIHGGLRYLEHFEFRMVRKALQEREVLLRSAPHIVRPLRFVMPHNAGLRPAWMVRMGLFLYDHLGRRELLAESKFADLASSPLGQPLRPGLRKGFVYSDAWVDDARLVVLNALDAAERGAVVLLRTRLVSAERGADRWEASLRPAGGGAPCTVRARALVNATGPWAESFQRRTLSIAPRRSLLMAKGSHIVVRRLFDHDHAYILQNPDKRIIFAIPYEREFTLIGTTDVAFSGDPARPEITPEETSYLCAMVNRYFNRQISPADVVWSYSGVRPLLEDETSDLSAVTRDYLLAHDANPGRAPLLSVFGGKITTYRKLAEEALDVLAPALGNARQTWTATAPLPGGDIVNADFDGLPRGPAARVCVAARRSSGALRARLRNPRRQHARRCCLRRPSRAGVRRPVVRGGSRLSGEAGMGVHGGRHPLAPLQARPARRSRYGGRARRGAARFPFNARKTGRSPCA